MIKRDRYLSKIDMAFKSLPIVVLIGARQVGKTSIMSIYPKDRFAKTLLLNGQDIETAKYFETFSTLENFLKINLDNSLNGLLMIDEFQFIDNVSTMLKLLCDKYSALKILCSGSSSLDIYRQTEESLAGRVRVIDMYSLSFSEYLQFCDDECYRTYCQISDYGDTTLTKKIIDRYKEYLTYGGFPRVALAETPEEKTELLNDIYQTYLLNDVRRYVSNANAVGFGRLLRLLASQIGNMMNINELSRECGLSYTVTENYIMLLQKMFIIRTAEPYYSNRRKTIGKMKKIYFCDLGLRNIIYKSFNDIDFRSDNGAIFENEIYLELCRNCSSAESVQFYRTLNGVEIDFVVEKFTSKFAVECKYKNTDKPMKIAAVNNFVKDEGFDRGYIANIGYYNNSVSPIMMPGIFAEKIS